MASNDWALLEQWRREGDSEAFGELVSRYAGMVYRTCCRVLGNTSDAQDLTQECFIQLARNPEQPRTHLGAWLHRVATTRSLNRLDSEKRRRQREKEYVESVDASTATDFSREFQDIIDEAIADLPEEVHGVIVEHFLNRRTHEAIAEDAGVSRQTITYRCQKGIELIRKALQRRGVLVPVSALFVALSSGTSEAVPATLAANLGRLALAGPRVLSQSPTAIQPVHWLSRIASTFSWQTIVGAGVVFLVLGAVYIVTPHSQESSLDGGSASAASAMPPTERGSVANALQTGSGQPAAKSPEGSSDPSAEPSNKCTFDFRVFDDSGPISKASILVERLTWERWEAPPPRTSTWLVESDSAGFARLSEMPPGFYLARAATNTHAGVTWIEAFDGGKAYGTSVWMSPAGTIEGTLVDEEGHPVSDADIGPCHWSENTVPMWHDYALALRVKSDDKGHFRLEHIRRGSWRVFVRVAGFAMTLTDFIPVDGPPVTITLGKGVPLRCKVVEATSREPLAGVTVMFSGPVVWDWFPAQTDSQGVILLPHSALGQHRVNVFDPVYFGVDGKKTVTVAKSDESNEVILMAVRGGQIEGRVYDVDTGQGIADAKVVLEDTARLSSATRPPSVTDSEGHYAIGGGLADCPGTLKVLEAPGYLASAQASAITVDHRADVRILGMDFPLHKGRPISGTAMTASGKPVGDVSIVGLGNKIGVRLETISEKDGSFVLEGFERGSVVHVFGSGEGMVSDTLGPFAVPDEGISGIRVVLQPESSISGVVSSLEGKPLVSWQIQASRVDRRSADLAPVVTDAEGRFMIRNLYAGTYAVCATPPRARINDQEKSERITLKVGEHCSDFLLSCDTSLSISGHVQGSTRARDGMLVECSGPVTTSVYTDDYGDFAIPALREGLYTIRVSGQGCCTAELTDIPAGTSDLFIQMRAMATVAGHVVRGDTQEPIASYEILHLPGEVERLPLRESLTFRFVQDPQGIFGLDRVEAGNNTIIVRASGFPLSFYPLIDVPSNGKVSGITISLDSGRTLRGIVLDEHRAPVGGVSLFLNGLPGRECRSNYCVGISDSDGHFQVDCIPRNSATLICYKDGFAPAQIALPAGDGALAPVSISLNPALQLQGIVTLGGEPVNGQEVNIRPLPESDGLEQNTQTEPDGTFIFDSLASGEAAIEAVLREGWLDPPQSRQLTTSLLLDSDTSDQVVLDFPQGEGLIVGTVTDEGRPVSGATVAAEFLLPNGVETIETQSSQDGHFLMEFVPCGTSSITVTDGMSGHHSYTKKVVVTLGEPTLLDIALDQELSAP